MTTVDGDNLYEYDPLNRLVTAHDNYVNSTRTYTYDSLSNLTYETGDGSHNCDYIYNNLDQQIDRSSDDWKSHTTSAYNKRGNLILEEYIKAYVLLQFPAWPESVAVLCFVCAKIACFIETRK